MCMCGECMDKGNILFFTYPLSIKGVKMPTDDEHSLYNLICLQKLTYF